MDAILLMIRFNLIDMCLQMVRYFLSMFTCVCLGFWDGIVLRALFTIHRLYISEPPKYLVGDCG